MLNLDSGESNPSQMDPKHGKTKLNMELQKEMSRDQAIDKKDGHKIEEDTTETEEDIKIEDDEFIDEQTRNRLYQNGVEAFNKGKKDIALKYFTACINGLSHTEGFAFLPQCLQKMADIYYNQEEYEKAVQFIHAEKMYYEMALIKTSGLQKELEENIKEKETKPEDNGEELSTTTEAKDPELLRAEEYEVLARLCLRKKQPDLALEYQGKATKLRQQLYGADHAITKESLVFFTLVYAEVGKQQYTESLEKFSENSSPDDSMAVGETQPEIRQRTPGILRKPSLPNDDSLRNKGRRVRFDEPKEMVQNRKIRETKLLISKCIQMVMFVFSVVTLICLLLYLYCRYEPVNHTCAESRSLLHYWYMRVKYIYYTWNNNNEHANRYG